MYMTGKCAIAHNTSLDSNTLHTRTEHHSAVEHPMACHLTSSDKEKNTSQQLQWIITFGWKNQFQTGTYAFMNIHNMICALIFAHTTCYRLCTSVHRPQQHFWLPRCDNNCQWQGYSYSTRCSPTLNIDISLHRKTCYSWKWKMNTDRNCEVKDTLLINCEIKDTLLNTDQLCIQGNICEHW